MKPILSVATAGLLADQLNDKEHQRHPRVDYLELQNLLKTDTLDYSAYEKSTAGGLFRRMEREIRSDIYLTLIGWWKSREYSTIFTWSERAGIPFAGIRRITRSSNRFITMFQSWSNRQERALTSLNLLPTMDAIIVHCASMKDNLIRCGAKGNLIHVIHYSVDEQFFQPGSNVEQRPGLIASLGETRSRDYDSLFKAIDGLPIQVDVAGYGHWYAREKNDVLRSRLPINVSISPRLSHLELRDYYVRSAFVVLPVNDLVYSAGATVALEAGCMARAVVAFHSPGIADYIVDGETGILIPPGDIAGLRDAIRCLHAHPEEAARMGANARENILNNFRLETYVRNIADVLLQTRVEQSA